MLKNSANSLDLIFKEVYDMFDEKNPKIMKYVPKGKLDSIKTAWIDSDGYWIVLKDNYNADYMDSNCRTIHEDTIPELRYQMKGIRKLTEKEMEERWG